MFKNGFIKQRKLWIINNSGKIIRALVFITIFVSAIIDPDVVLADPVMGGSVGRTFNAIRFFNLMKILKNINLP